MIFWMMLRIAFVQERFSHLHPQAAVCPVRAIEAGAMATVGQIALYAGVTRYAQLNSKKVLYHFTL